MEDKILTYYENEKRPSSFYGSKLPYMEYWLEVVDVGSKEEALEIAIKKVPVVPPKMWHIYPEEKHVYNQATMLYENYKIYNCKAQWGPGAPDFWLIFYAELNELNWANGKFYSRVYCLVLQKSTREPDIQKLLTNNFDMYGPTSFSREFRKGAEHIGEYPISMRLNIEEWRAIDFESYGSSVDRPYLQESNAKEFFKTIIEPECELFWAVHISNMSIRSGPV